MNLIKSAIFNLLCAAVVAEDILSNIENEVGVGGRNTVSFSASYANDGETACDPCVLCEGSSVNDMFNPKKGSVCVACESEKNPCNQLVVTTSFQTPWAMEYVSLSSHDGEESLDPKTVTVQGSNDGTWSTLTSHSFASVFKERNTAEDLIVDNKTSYSQYRVLFHLKDGTTKMKVGHYGLIEAFLKTYTFHLHEKITNQKLVGLPTLEPTPSPTPEPTVSPTEAYNWVRGPLGGTCEQACAPRKCNADKQTELNSYQKMTAVMKILGGTPCSSEVAHRNYAGTPFQSAETKACVFFSPSGKSVCNANGHGHHWPICYCE